jgi:TetR/AcrR family transcriptional regulator, regulator of cefoperazone and chloramphenicol sensitivity
MKGKFVKKQRCDGQETRHALLEAAGEIFVQKGFWEATNADICARAGVNTALINYHFGSKENLYVESWKYAFKKSLEKYPTDGGVNPNAPVKERFYGQILSLMQRIADPANFDFDIIHKEMANPTGLLDEVIVQAIEPSEQNLKSVIRELFGEKASEKQVLFSHMIIKGQCFGPMLHLRRIRREGNLFPHKKLPLNFDIEELAGHIVQFSLSGIAGILGQSINIEKGTPAAEDKTVVR